MTSWPIGVLLAPSPSETPADYLARLIERVGRVGIEPLLGGPAGWQPADVPALIAAARQAEVPVLGFCVPGPTPQSAAGPPSPLSVLHEPRWRDCLDSVLSSAMGSGFVLTVCMAGGTNLSSPDARDATGAWIRGVADLLAERGMVLALEPAGQPADAWLDLLGWIDHPHVRVTFNPGLCVRWGCEEPLGQLRDLRPFVAHVHLSDGLLPEDSAPGEPAPLGQGDAEVARVVSRLRATGYEGALIIDGRDRDAALDALADDLDWLRTLLA